MKIKICPLSFLLSASVANPHIAYLHLRSTPSWHKYCTVYALINKILSREAQQILNALKLFIVQRETTVNVGSVGKWNCNQN